jgi:hypothetical protein
LASVDTQSINAVKESMQRCLGQPKFIDYFHGEFMNNSEVREKFKNTNVVMQKAILKSTLHVMLNAALGSPGSGMLKFAVSHDKNNKAIPPHLYRHWLDALLISVKTVDSQLTSEIERSWRVVMQPGIDFMIEWY